MRRTKLKLFFGSIVRGVNQLGMILLRAVDYSKEIVLKVSEQQPQGPLRNSHHFLFSCF